MYLKKNIKYYYINLYIMKIAIMQPYFLPSIYYWQLINYVDTFVILDDVKFMSKKFSHMNFIYYNKKKIQLTLFFKKKKYK